MSGMSELHAEQDHSIMECMLAEEEQAYYNAINEVKGFIESGAVSFEKVKYDIGGEK